MSPSRGLSPRDDEPFVFGIQRKVLPERMPRLEDLPPPHKLGPLCGEGWASMEEQVMILDAYSRYGG